jgi:hypothetical protein
VITLLLAAEWWQQRAGKMRIIGVNGAARQAPFNQYNNEYPFPGRISFSDFRC